MAIYFGSNKVKPSGIKNVYFGNNKVYEFGIPYRRYTAPIVEFIANAHQNSYAQRTKLEVPFETSGTTPIMSSQINIVKLNGDYMFDLTISKSKSYMSANSYWELHDDYAVVAWENASDYRKQYGYLIAGGGLYQFKIQAWHITNTPVYVDEVYVENEITDGVHDLGDGEYWYEKIV